MRTVAVFLLCLFIALQGNAKVHEFQKPCPMEHKAGSDFSEKTGDCCNDAETVAKTGKLCKTVDTCSSSGASLCLSSPLGRCIPQRFDLTPQIQSQHASADLLGVWRPPTSS